MLEVDRLLRDGLWRPSQRNDAFLKLTWYMRVIWKFDAARTEVELWSWIQQFHNGNSSEYQQNPEKVRRKVRDAVRHFDPEKVGQQSAYKPPVSPQMASAGLEQAVEQYVDSLPLDSTERAFLAELLRYAHRRGEISGQQIEVQIPSRTLQTWNWQYSQILRDLLRQGYIEKARNYTTRGRCNTYKVPCLAKPTA